MWSFIKIPSIHNFFNIFFFYKVDLNIGCNYLDLDIVFMIMSCLLNVISYIYGKFDSRED